MQILFNAFSQRGIGKAHNEDAMLLGGKIHQGRVRENGSVHTLIPCYFAVADGVSIGTRPRTASRRLLELFNARVVMAPNIASMSGLLQLLQQDYVSISSDAALYGMASTLVGVRVFGNAATIFNVGDSRAYLLTGDAKAADVRLLSRDHSYLSDLIDDGEITQAQSETAASFMRGLTSQFIADAEFDDFKVYVVSHVMQPGERLLLCSDGLNEILSDTQIATLLVNRGEDDLLNACKASRRVGGTDDFSVIVLEIHG